MSVTDAASKADTAATKAAVDTLNAGPVVDMKQAPRVLRRIIIMGLKYRGRLGIALAAMMGSVMFGLLMPRLFGHAVDQAHSLLNVGGDRGAVMAALWTTALLVIGASVIRGGLQLVSGYFSEWVSQRVAYNLRLEMFQKLQKLSFSFHDRIHSGDLISRAMLDIEGTRNFIGGAGLQLFSVVFMSVASAYMMFSTEPDLAWMALLFVPIAAWQLARMGVLLRITFLKMQQAMADLTQVMEENLQGVRVVRAFASKAFEMGKFEKSSSAALKLAFQRINIRFTNTATLNILFFFSQGLLLYFGLHRVIDGEMTLGRLTEFLLYLNMLQAPVRMVAMIFMAAARATSCGGRVFEILDLDVEILDKPGAKDLDAKQGVLRFEDVGFKYDTDGPEVLRHITFEVQPGKALGIVGPPGSGKSTIANLVPRFYDVSSGRITIDGQDIRDVTLQSLRSFVGLVQQEAFLFDTTVTNNLAYADPWAEEDRLVGAARTSQIHEYLNQLPARYETRVGERGVSLSGGQRQRMSIARGIVPGPGIMIFDDSTAAIDAVTERRVRESLAEATKLKSTIIIAHRLSSLMHAEEIIVLNENGEVAERGTHASLLAAGGRYADLYELQSKALSDRQDEPEEERV